MNPFEIFMLSVGLAMDAFAVAIGIGLALRLFDWRKAFIVGAWFGVFQAFMPLAGYFVGFWFADFVAAVGDIIAFVLLTGLGGKMIWGSFQKSGHDEEETSLGVLAMFPLAIATSVDAMAVGVGLAFLYVNIALAAVVIGVVTFAISAAGVKVGNVFGIKFKSKAESAGGLILILIALRVLLW